MATESVAVPSPSAAKRRSKPVRRGAQTSAHRRSNPAVYAIAGLLISVMLAPVLYVIIGGFRTNSQISADPSGLPSEWQFGNYGSILKGSVFWKLSLNSTITALATTVGVVVLGLMVSFVLARYNFRGRGALYSLYAAGLMFPMTVAITPLYIIVRALGLHNNIVGVILPQIAFGLPMTVIILVPFLRAIPNELQEAAEIDGCSRLGFFWRMVLPLSVPGVITVGILSFIGSWNAYMLPLFILNDEASATLPLGVQQFASEHSVDTAMVLAFTSLAMLPALVFFSLFERRIVGGLTGAVKG